MRPEGLQLGRPRPELVLPGDFLSLGGMIGYEDTNIGPGNPPSNPTTMRVTADLRRYHAPETRANAVGSWEEVKNFLGPNPTDVRIMHVATLLPTKQILVVGGGNYPYHDPLVRPILLTADKTAPGGYRLKYMNPGTQPRLYHCVSLLLPDGRVFVAGGNPGRAARSEDGSTSGSTRPATARGPTASSSPAATSSRSRTGRSRSSRRRTCSSNPATAPRSPMPQ